MVGFDFPKDDVDTESQITSEYTSDWVDGVYRKLSVDETSSFNNTRFGLRGLGGASAFKLRCSFYVTCKSART